VRGLPPPGWKRRLAIGAALALALRALLPGAIERIAESQGSQALGVPLRIGDVDLALLVGGVGIEQLRVGSKGQPLDVEEVDPAGALLSLERVGARIAWLELLRGRIRLRELEVVAPQVRVAREADGRIVPLPEKPPAPPEIAAEAQSQGGAVLPLAVDRFALRDARVALVSAQDPTQELLGFGLEELTLADFALDEDGIALGAIGLRRPTVRVKHELALGEETPEPSEAAPPASAAAPETPAVPAAAAPAPPFRVQRVAIERAAFTLVMRDSALDVALALSADGVTAQRGVTFPAKLGLELARGTLEADGKVGVDPPLFDGTLRWNGLALPMLLEPLPPGPADWLEAATASGDLRISAQLAPAEGPPEIRVSGSLGLADLAVRNPAQDLSLAWKALEVEIDELRVPLPAQGQPAAPPQLALRKLRLVEPSARVVLAEAKAAPETAAPAQPATAEAPPVSSGPAAAQPQVSVASLEVVGGRVEFLDRNVKPEYKAQLRNLTIGARELRWPQQDIGELRAGFTGPAEAVLDLRGALRNRAGELRLKLDRVAVAGFNPYAKSAAGVEIARGNFSLDTRARASRSSWRLSNDVRLHDLSLASGGSATVPSVGLPLSAVLALLRDPKGDIALSVPLEVEGRLARAGIGSLIRSALRQALVGVVSSPLKLIGFVGGVAGIGGDQPPTLAFAPGGTELAEGEAERLGAIAALLSERPALGLVLRGRAGGADATPVAEQELRDRIEAGDEPELPDSGFLQRRRLRNALEVRARGGSDELDAEDRGALERWIAATPVPPERIQALAAERAEQLLERLVAEHGVARARLSLADPLEGEPAVALEIAAVPES
jgi:hypothetical protein